VNGPARGIPGDAAMAQLGKAEAALPHREGVVGFGAHARSMAVLGLLDEIGPAPVTIAPMGHIAGAGRVLVSDFGLSLVRRVAPRASLLAVQRCQNRE
jgi:hypothetical protein